ncbi:translation initiation factor IF-2-like [Myotis myotis]|uniref:translation initiation factor IF-2-like n=1 Tax=Myotis myotis TaxID=51298 RepID=UPI00174DA5CF|nr:translation initiation factor IF-2-like [Myotis myotis]
MHPVLTCGTEAGTRARPAHPAPGRGPARPSTCWCPGRAGPGQRCSRTRQRRAQLIGQVSGPPPPQGRRRRFSLSRALQAAIIGQLAPPPPRPPREPDAARSPLGARPALPATSALPAPLASRSREPGRCARSGTHHSGPSTQGRPGPGARRPPHAGDSVGCGRSGRARPGPRAGPQKRVWARGARARRGHPSPFRPPADLPSGGQVCEGRWGRTPGASSLVRAEGACGKRSASAGPRGGAARTGRPGVGPAGREAAPFVRVSEPCLRAVQLPRRPRRRAGCAHLGRRRPLPRRRGGISLKAAGASLFRDRGRRESGAPSPARGERDGGARTWPLSPARVLLDGRSRELVESPDPAGAGREAAGGAGGAGIGGERSGALGPAVSPVVGPATAGGQLSARARLASAGLSVPRGPEPSVIQSVTEMIRMES